MQFKNYFLLPLLVVVACKISSARGLTHTLKRDTDVYIVGSVEAANGHSVAAYWENGVVHKLSDSTVDCLGESIAINGDDVYVIGNYAPGKVAAVYWKNGKEINLTVDTLQSLVNGIVVNGNNIYIAGIIIDKKGNHAAYWKNGIITILPSNSSICNTTALSISGTDVYVAGNIGDTAVYWKNGLPPKKLWDDKNLTGYNKATAIAVDGTNICIAGYTSMASNHNLVATYWINDVAAFLTAVPDSSYDAEVRAIALKGSNIYAAGFTTAANNNQVAIIWKNGKAIYLTDDKISAQLQSIALIGNDVYATGLTSVDGVAYWKNGVVKPLPGYWYEARSIVVVSHLNN